VIALPSDSAAELLAEVDALGIDLEAQGDRLRFRPREAVTPDLALRIKGLKANLLAALAIREAANRLRKVAAAWPADWRERWEERAGIMEYDGGARRIVAEDRAFQGLVSVIMAEHGIDYVPGSIATGKLLGTI
jgi:hypothetical protein